MAKIALLRELARTLRSVEPDAFDMGDWIKGPSTNPQDCGTVACIAGWATTIPEAGLVITNRGDLRYKGRDICGIRAFAYAFGIPLKDAYDLCTCDACHQTPGAAADAVDALADQYEQEENPF